MNKKNFLKLILDICMIIVLVLMYNKNSVNMTFHELGGLILLGVFLIHIIINYKWVIVVTKKLFSNSLPFKTKLGYILNILLFIAFALIGISGIFISKILFKINTNSSIPWKSIHYSAAAFALILIGIHVGLHRQFIWGIFQKLFRMPKAVSMTVGILLTLVIFSYGCYNIYSTSFTRWLVMPFSSQQTGSDKGNQNMHGDFKGSDGPQMQGDAAITPSANAPAGPSDISGTPDNLSPNQGSQDSSTSTDSGSSTAQDSNNSTSADTNAIQDSSTSDNSASVQNTPNGAAPNGNNGDFDRPSGDFKGNMPGDKGQSGGISTALFTIIEFFSIIYVFATITALIEIVVKKSKIKKVKPDTTE